MKKFICAFLAAVTTISSFALVSCGKDSSATYTCSIGMAGLTINEKRLESVDFSDEYYSSAQVLIVKSDDTTYDECKTAEAAEAILAAKDKSYKIGAQNGTTGYMYSAGDADFGYDGFNVTVNGYTTGALAVMDLANGKVDAVVIDKQPALMIAESVNASATKVKVIDSIELTEESYAFAINKSATDLKATVNAFLTEAKGNGSLATLINSYFDGTATFKYTNKTSSPKADDFVVATNAYFPPFESIDGKAFVGVDIEIASLIANKLGKNLFVLDMDFDAIIPTVQKN